jgi:hypothetical protein
VGLAFELPALRLTLLPLIFIALSTWVFVVLYSTMRLAGGETIPYHFQRTNGLNAYIPIVTP